MRWKLLLYVPDLIISPFFIYLLVLLGRSKYEIHHTPFYRFFISTGVCGVITVLTHFTVNQVPYSPDQHWIMQVGLGKIEMLNENGTLGATIGKFFIALHRFCVIRQFVVRETVWPNWLVRILILIQFLLPTASSIFFLCPSFSPMSEENGRVILSLGNRALLIQKYVNTWVFSVYCVACVVLTYLSTRKLSSVGRNLECRARRSILKQQYNLLLIVSVCCISHLLKAAQQFSVLLISSLQLDRRTSEAIIWPTVGQVITVDSSTSLLRILSGWLHELEMSIHTDVN